MGYIDDHHGDEIHEDYLNRVSKKNKRKTKSKAGKYVIIDLRNMDFMKNEQGKIEYYDTEDEACLVCGMYEFENAWVMKLVYNHIEKD
jgi:hypothetical protein